MTEQDFSRRARFLLQAAKIAGWGYYLLRVAARFALGRRPTGVQRILVARRSRLGDLVTFLPTLAALRARFPHAYIVLGVQPGMSASVLLGDTPDVDEVRELDFLEHPTALGRLAGVLRFFGEGFDLVITGARYFLLREPLFSGAPRRLGVHQDPAVRALHSRALALDPTRHEAENNLALVELLGAKVPPAERAPTLRLESGPAAEEAQRLLEALGVPEEASLLLVHPGAQKPSRRWPAERFADLVHRLLEERPELWVVFTGVPDERPLVEAIRSDLPAALRARAPSSVGLSDLPTMTALLDRSAAFVCNDTGVMHLARARGTPLVALLGPENDLRWGPHPLGAAPAIALRYPVPCAPCERWDCPVLYCLRSLGVEEAAAAVTRILEMPRSVAGGEPTPSLTRQITPRSWRDLEEAGFEVPLVSVVLLPEGFSAPRNGAAAATGNPEDTDAALASLGWQDYPRFEAIRVETGGSAGVGSGHPPVSRFPVRMVRVPADDAAAAWRAVMDAARGEIITPLLPGAEWPADKLSSDVALLVRHPELQRAAGDAPPLHASYRRAALEAFLSAGRNGGGPHTQRGGMVGWLGRGAAAAPSITSGS